MTATAEDMRGRGTAEPLQQLMLRPDVSLRSVIDCINRFDPKIALIVDDIGKLMGTITDGDVRRALLGGLDLNAPAEAVMNRTPKTLRVGDDPAEAFEIMRRLELRQIPILDDTGKVVGLELLQDFLTAEPMENLVVIMAGGQGRRLRPLTESLPKPMLPVGGRPILETIIEGFARQGFRDFVLSVNYLADRIKTHFANGRQFGVQIDYLTEDRPLGTAGALRLMRVRPSQPFLVANGDVLTKLDYRRLLHFHQSTGACVTICVQRYQHSVPFGVVQVERDRVLALREKPLYECYVNSGIYVLDPSVIDLLPEDEAFDMPQLIEQLLVRDRSVSAFPIHEYWVDVGRMEDLDRADAEFAKVFDDASPA